MTNHTENRDSIILEELRQELVGPAPAGKELDITREVAFETKEDSFGAWTQKGTGEEILTRDGPRVRYGVGVLHPFQETAIEDDLIGDGTIALENPDEEGSDERVDPSTLKEFEEISSRSATERDEAFSLSSANAYHQSAMAVSFVLAPHESGILDVIVTGGRYEQFRIKAGSKSQIWWKRIPVILKTRIKAADLIGKRRYRIDAFDTAQGAGQMKLVVELFLRDSDEGSSKLVTVSLTNRTATKENYEQRCLFQSYFCVAAIDDHDNGIILPYPTTKRALDDEEKSLELLYREMRTFAVGHGCAADWKLEKSKATARSVEALAFPTFEVPSITPDIEREDGTKMEIPMLLLSDGSKREESIELLKELVREYRAWIASKYAQVRSDEFPADHREIAEKHIAFCSECAKRMEGGITLLEKNDAIYTAFKLANEAVLLQQIQSKRAPREASFNDETTTFNYAPEYAEPDVLNLPPKRGKWRPFQIGFLLLSLSATAKRDDPDREIVDLIWFPTGGGKTEAYLGLAAFSMFFGRLGNTKEHGVNVMMRYTLRLLTAQQFQRTSSLICAMEVIRKRNSFLGTKEFGIGIWLGGDVTPNTNEKAVAAYNKLEKHADAKNPFLLSKCPWCACKMGRFNGHAKFGILRVRGCKSAKGEVTLHCPDPACRFYEHLPVYICDQQLYARRPSFIIATVDKFAGVAWSSDPRSLFGIGPDGARFCDPPNLIIQDELHLISGPLGSVFGLYETLIEEMCSVESDGQKLKPKIIASTATIRRFEKQISDLYSRSESRLFPPPGIDVGDSFFARFDIDPITKALKPGRRYVGVFAANLGSLQTAEQRVYAALAQAPMNLADAIEKDPWWTLLLFFNSLRELGTSVSLLQSDVPTYLKAIRNRKGITPLESRRIANPRELTSRLKNDEVPRALEELEITCDKRSSVDVCLASNIIEVGVDIDRLGLMAVVGQPKSTAQYIQVTGRVGRQTPGLVVTIYAVSKPRDRSHFEKFRSYHERLYAQVEPTSVTPFSRSVLERALHAVLVGYVRQYGNTSIVKSPAPFPSQLLGDIADLLIERVEAVAPEQVPDVERLLAKRLREWKKWAPYKWNSRASDDTPLLREAGAYAPLAWKHLTWSTQRSMRNVDHECQTVITPMVAIEENSHE